VTRRNSAAIGASAEAAVRVLLTREGWTLLAANWRGAGGELDIVASRENVLRVVEVKARARADGSALEAVTRSKQRRITAATEAFLAAHLDLDFDEINFCVVTVEGQVVTWYDDAFDACY
jgi:putative endonuclease